MEDGFVMTVNFNGRELEFATVLKQYGHTVKIEVEIEGTKVIFEPDEERNWRATISWEDVQANTKLNRELLQAIAETIESITK